MNPVATKNTVGHATTWHQVLISVEKRTSYRWEYLTHTPLQHFWKKTLKKNPQQNWESISLTASRDSIHSFSSIHFALAFSSFQCPVCDTLQRKHTRGGAFAFACSSKICSCRSSRTKERYPLVTASLSLPAFPAYRTHQQKLLIENRQNRDGLAGIPKYRLTSKVPAPDGIGGGGAIGGWTNKLCYLAPSYHWGLGLGGMEITDCNWRPLLWNKLTF